MHTAILGTGLIAGAHAQVLQNLGHEITVVVNPNLEKAIAFGEKWEAKHIESSLEAALELDLDTVHVCTPPVSHVKIVKACIEAGVHVFCEKPLAVDADDAAELYTLVEASNLIHAVNFNNRFYPVCTKAKTAIKEEGFGSPHLIHGIYLQQYHVLPDYYSWRYKPEVGGHMRAVTEIGSHWIDLARYWTGLEIESVSANFGCFNPDRKLENGMMHPAGDEANLHITSEDAASITFHFSNGAMGNVLFSEVSHGRRNQIKLEVSSAENSIWWNSDLSNQLNKAQKFTEVTTQTSSLEYGFMDAFTDSLTAFYDDVEKGEINPNPCYATFKDGAINAMICDAIYKSAMNESIMTKVQTI